MDPNLQAPAPEQTPTPTPMPTPNPAPIQTPTPGGQPPKKLGTGAIIAIVGGALFIIALIIGIAIAVNAMVAKENTDTARKDDSSQTDETDKEVAKREPITATMPVNLQVVCIGGSVENAAPFKKPYNYVLFDNNNVYKDPSARKDTLVPFEDGNEWFLFGVGSSDETSSIDTKSDPSLFNSVICLDRIDTTAVKTMTCELLGTAGMKATDSTVADYSSVKYKVTIYEAQTGKLVKDLGTINGPATKCPIDKYYHAENPGIYGDADIDELNAKIKEFEK